MPNDASKFWSLVDRQPSGHWLWTRPLTAAGHGQFSWNGRVVRTHLLAWELVHGRRPDRRIWRQCSAAGCINPAHHGYAPPVTETPPRSSSGVLNVYRHTNGQWHVRVHRNGKLMSFGLYDTVAEAAAVAEAAREGRIQPAQQVSRSAMYAAAARS